MSGLRISEDMGKFINPTLIPFGGHEELQGIMDPFLGLHTGNQWSLDHEKEIVGAGAAVAAILATIFSGGAAAAPAAAAAEGATAGAATAGGGLLGGLGAGAAAEGVGSLAPAASGAGVLSALPYSGAAASSVPELANASALSELFSPASNPSFFASAPADYASLFGPTAEQSGLLALGSQAEPISFITQAPLAESPMMGMPGFAGSMGTDGASWLSQMRGGMVNAVGGLDNFDKITGAADKLSKAAGVGNAVMKSQQQQPMRAPQAPRISRPQPLAVESFYSTPDEEKKRQMAMLMMQQQGGYYG